MRAQEVAINDNFAKMTEALYVAEQAARTAVEHRSKVQREIAAREKEQKDRELRELAIKARQDRMGGGAQANPSLAARDTGTNLPPPPSRRDEVSCRNLSSPASSHPLINICTSLPRLLKRSMASLCRPGV